MEEQGRATGVNRKKSITIIVVAVVLFVLGWIVLGKVSRNNPTPPKVTAPVTAEVDMNEDGFNPATIKVKAGTVVIWKSTDSESHRVVSNPHPTHGDLPGLDSKSNIGPDDTYSYTFDKVGTYKYHDELDPTRNGTVVVE